MTTGGDEDAQGAPVPRNPETGGVDLSSIVNDPDLMLAALEEFSDREHTRIAFETVDLGERGTVEVSTVDLVWAAPGGAFETAVFGPIGDGPHYMQRYRTRNAAALGHGEVVAGVRAGLFDVYLFDRADAPQD